MAAIRATPKSLLVQCDICSVVHACLMVGTFSSLVEQ